MWKISVRLTDGRTITYDDETVIEKGISVTEEVSESTTFAIGTCVCREATVQVKDEEANANDFYNAEVLLSYNNEAYGTFVCNTAVSKDGIITLSCYDYMIYTDRLITSVITGATLGAMAASICDTCGLALGTPTFDGYDIPVTVPDTGEMTYRELLGYIAQAGCNFVRIDREGRVVFEWYRDIDTILDGGVFDPAIPFYATGANVDGGDFTYKTSGEADGGIFGDMADYRYLHQIFSLDVATDDIVITGVQVKNDENSSLSGTDEYMLSIEDNPLTEGKESYFAEYIGSKVNGLCFRTFHAAIPDLIDIKAGEAVYVTDIDCNAYKSFITKVSYTINSETTIECNAKTPVRQSVRRNDIATKILTRAKQNTGKQIKTYDQTVQDMTSLISQGFGLYFTKLEDTAGGTKLYMHDKQTIEESTVIWTITTEGLMVSTNGTATWAVDKNGNALFNVITARGINADWVNIGGQGNGDGRLVVKSSSGTPLIILDNQGITMADGTSLINASGVCGDLTFTSGGTPYDLGYAGNVAIGNFRKQELFLQAVIPDNYVITSAVLVLSTCATIWNNIWDADSSGNPVYHTATGYPRAVKAYIGTGQVYKEAAWDGEYGFSGTGSYTQVISGGFTSGGVDGSTSTAPKQIKSGNIRTMLKTGLNTIKITIADFTGDTNLTYAQRTGTATALLSIKGYTKNQ